ncbi:hypothetical protein B0H14DRAFT_3865476 [Mycena olivaceomarginata]|nr:hypothetical protein B0H14DRAFT_3865476 [Mycena olivaceomarginata]
MPVGRCTLYRGGGTGAGWRGERSWTPYALRGGRGSISSLLRCAGGELSLLRRRTLSHLCGWRGRALSAGTYPRSSTGLPSSTSEHHRASLRPPSFNFLASSIRLRRLVLHGARPRVIAFTALHAPTALPHLHTTPRPAHARSRYRFIRLARGPVRDPSLTVSLSDGRINWPSCHALRMPAVPDSGPQTAAVHLSSSASVARVVALLPRRRAPSGPHLPSALPRMPDRLALGCGCRKRSSFRRRGDLVSARPSVPELPLRRGDSPAPRTGEYILCAPLVLCVRRASAVGVLPASPPRAPLVTTASALTLASHCFSTERGSFIAALLPPSYVTLLVSSAWSQHRRKVAESTGI